MSDFTVSLTIKPEKIAGLMISAIESGDPVTTAARGGWCAGIYAGSEADDPPGSTEEHGPWYANPDYWARDFTVEIIEVDDERTGHTIAHRIGRAQIISGLQVMVSKFPIHFANAVSDDDDAETADIFLQCVCFGELRYG